MTQIGARSRGMLRGYWPGSQAESGSESGRGDFLRIVGAYLTDREIRMAPGWKCVIDPTDPEPGNDGYLALVRDSMRPVAAPSSSTSYLREHLNAAYNPELPSGSGLHATLHEQKVYARPTHLWSVHRVRDRVCLIGETGIRVEPILDTIGTITKCTGWTIPSSVPGGTLSGSSGSASVIRVPIGTAFEWMEGVGIKMTSGPASGSTTVISDVQMDTGAGYANINVSPAFSGIPVAGNTYELRNDVVGQTKKLGSFTLTPAAWSPAAGTPNKVEPGDVLWIDEIPSSQTDSAILQRRAHYVYDVLTGPLRLILGSAVTTASTETLSLNIGRCRGNAAGTPSFTVNGMPYYGLSEANKLLDRPSLTAWWVEDEIDVDGDPVKKVYASYVANRQRDYGDQSQDNPDARTGMTRMIEGHRPSWATTAQKWGIPRRMTMQAPYRGVSRVAGNRVLVAVPGYGCMFEIPAIVPATSSILSQPGRGAVDGYNHHGAKPRSCGVPKAVLSIPNNTDGTPLVRGRADSLGFALGSYRFAIAYRDEATGEMGQLSEPWDTSNTTGRTKSTAEIAANGGGHTTTQTNFSTTTHGYSAAALTNFTLHMLTGANAGQSRLITGNTTGNIQHAAFASANANGDTWEIRGSSLTISLMPMHPGYVLSETMALSVMVFMSRVGETAMQHVATIQLGDDLTTYSGLVYINGSSASSTYGLPVTDGANAAPDAVQHFYFYTLPLVLATTPSLYNTRVELPVQRSMPKGASWVAVVRGVPLSGGSIGNVGPRLELASGKASLVYEATHSNQPDEMSLRKTNENAQPIDEWPLVANQSIPSSYGGAQVWTDAMAPHPIEMLTLDRVLNSHTSDPSPGGLSTSGIPEQPQRRWQRWKLIENPHRWNQYRDVRDASVHLVLPRGLIQVHEPGLPSVSLPIGNQFLDANKDEDSVAGGEYRGTAMIFTQRQTYGMTWDHGPAGSTPVLLTSEFGCIAPNTVIEHDAGTLWLSERGIVDWSGGQPVFGGRAIERWFRGEEARFLRDSQGMMRQAWAFWDEGRGVAWIGLTENRSGSLTVEDSGSDVSWDDADDGVRSRFPCDTILAYDARTRTISEVQPPDGLEMLWAGPMTCSDGVQRMCVLAADQRVYVHDDLFGQDNQEPLQVSTTTTGTGTAISVSSSLSGGDAIGQAYANRGGVGSFVRAGMDVCLFDANYQLKGRTTAVSATAGSLVVADPLTWVAGDRLLIGGRSMSITTAFMQPKGSEPATVSAFRIVAALRSRITKGKPDSINQPVWAKVTVVYHAHQSGRHGGGDDLLHRQRMHSNALGDLVGFSTASEIVRTVRLTGGQPNVMACSFEIEVFGGAHVSIQDFDVEAG